MYCIYNVSVANPDMHTSYKRLMLPPGDSFKETINIYPSGKVQYHLQDIKDGQSLRDARMQGGQPVIDSSTSTDVSDGVASNIANLHSVADDNYPPSKAGNVFTVAENPSSAANNASHTLKHTLLEPMALPSLPRGGAVGVAVMNGNLQQMSTHAVHTLLHTSKALKLSFNPIEIAGDIWHHIESIGGTIVGGIKDGVVQLDNGIHFVITHLEDGLHFVLSLTNGVVTIALKSLALVFKALNYVLKLIGIDLSKLMRWLGHLLGWDEIWDTHKVIAGYMTNAVDYAAGNGMHYLDVARSAIDSVLTGFDELVRKALLPDDVGKNDLVQTKTNSQDQTVVNMNSPQMNFAAYHINQSQGQSTTESKADSQPHLAVTSLYDQLIAPLATTLIDKMGRNAEDLVHLFTHGTIEDIKRILFDLVDTVIALVKQFLDSLVELAKEALGTLRNLLEEDLDIPVVGAIYEFVTSLFGEEESFTIINGISFIIAIPITVVMKCADLGSFAASEAVQAVSAADGVKNLVETAMTKPATSTLKSAFHAVSNGHIMPLKAIIAPPPEPSTKVSSKDAASAAALSVVAMSATAVNSVLAVPVTGALLDQARAAMTIFQTACSVPWWSKKIGKSDAAVGLRWTRWTIAVFSVVVMRKAQQQNMTKKEKAEISLAFGAIGTIFTLIIDGVDQPQGPLKEEAWASDCLLNAGALSRAGGQYMIEGGNDLAGGIALGAGVLSLWAGAGTGLHIAVENYKEKEVQPGLGGFLAAGLNIPIPG